MFPNLIFLDLSANQIRQIKHNAFFVLTILRALYLGRNQISFIEKDAFVNVLNLTHLVLAYNELQGVDFYWFRNLKSSWIHTWPSSMKRVNLNNNKIPVFLPIPKHAEMFLLGGNPIYCRCKPETFKLYEISNLTLFEVKMECNSVKLKGVCKTKQLYKVLYKFWKDISGKPICQAPVIKELSYFTNQEGLPSLTCVTTGVPAPDVTLYSNDTEQKIQVKGIAKTTLPQRQLYSGTYHCNASNIIGVTRN